MSALPEYAPRWITWRRVDKTGKDGKPKTIKEPTHPKTGRLIDACADRDYWRRDELPRDVAHGWVLGRDGGWFYIGFDFDTCYKDGKLTPWAREALDVLDSYAEISPSGTGFKVWVRVDRETYDRIRELIDGSKNRKWAIGGGDHPPGIQLFLLGYFTFTGKALDDSPVRTIDLKTVQRVIAIGERIKREAEIKDDYKVDDSAALQKLAFKCVWKMERDEFYEAVAEDDEGQAHVDRQKDGDRAMNRSWAGALICRFAHDMKADGKSKHEHLNACMAHPEIRGPRLLTEHEVTTKCHREWKAAPAGASLLNVLDEDPDRSDAPRSKREFLTVADLKTRPRPHDFVEGLLFAGCMSVWAGKPKTGKSYLLLGLAHAVACGDTWAGRAVDKGGVLIIALEGVGMLYDRVRALELASKKSSPVIFSPTPLNLLKGRADLAEIIEFVRKGKITLVILDTFARAMPGAKESSFEDMSRAIAALDRIKDETGAHVAVVHHEGYSRTGPRGSSDIVAAPDLIVEITRDKGADARMARIAENRHGADGECLRFTLQSATLDFKSARNKPVVSATVKLEGEWFEDLGEKEGEMKLTESETAAVAILRKRAAIDNVLGPLLRDEARALLKRKAWGPKDAEAWRQAWRRLLPSLQRKGAVEIGSNGEMEIGQ